MSPTEAIIFDQILGPGLLFRAAPRNVTRAGIPGQYERPGRT